MTVKHTKVSTVPDGGDSSQIQPSDWNAEHSLTMNDAGLLGKSTVGVGEAEDITLGDGLVFTGTSLNVQVKTVNGTSILGEGDVVIESGSGKLSATNPVIEGSITEDVYAISGTTPAIDPANGTIQTWALTGASTPTDSLSSGQSLTLMINDGTDYTITWPSVVWVGGSAPTLAPTGYTVIELWKVGSTLYGALVGSIA